MPAPLRRVRARLTFANVTSSLALFIALGGTSYAQIVLARDSVTDREIRRGAVGTSEIRTGGVGRAEIRTGGVSSSELRTNSVGSNEIRSRAVRADEISADAVGAEEVQAGAIGTSEVADGALGTDDLSAAARASLTDASAVTFRAAVGSAGALGGGNAATAVRSGAGVYTVGFGRDVTGCQVAATRAAVRTGTTLEAATPGFVTVDPNPAANAGVVVRTFDPAGTAADAPFHLLVAC